MNKMEKLEQIVTGLETKLQMKKSELEKVKNTLSDLNISTTQAMNELNRLKNVGNNLDQSITEKRQQVQEKDSALEMSSLLDELGKGLR